MPEDRPWRSDYLDDVDRRQCRDATCSAGPATTAIPTTSSAPSSVRHSPQWGFDNQEIFDALDDGPRITDAAERTQLYEEANKMIMEFLPGVPYVHTQPALAFASNVDGYVPEPGVAGELRDGLLS